jgi:preprotein translocase subunit SecE
VARQTRQQRRERRAQRAEATESTAAVARPQPPAPKPPARIAPEETAAPSERRFPGAQFVSESWAELKKVEWPTQSQVIQATVVVLIACAIVGTYLWAADLVFKPLVQKIFLK